VSVSLVLTLIGPDRPGLVEAVAQTVADHDGNWLESRMARMAGQFAGIVRVAVTKDRMGELAAALRALSGDLEVVIASNETEAVETGERRLRLDLLGSDQPGIIRNLSQALAQRGVNVDSLETSLESAPMSGELLFRASAELLAPVELDLNELGASLEALGQELMVEVTVEEAGD
jgi:glycine cleavage system regulatory protein